MTQPFELPELPRPPLSPLVNWSECSEAVEESEAMDYALAYGKECYAAGFAAGRRDATMQAASKLVQGNPEFTVERIAEKLALATDAKRYRWLRENAYIELQCDSPRVAGWSPEDLDAKVDAARRASRLPAPEGATP